MSQNLGRDAPFLPPQESKTPRARGGTAGANANGGRVMGPADLEWEHLIIWGLLKSPLRWTISPRQPRIFRDPTCED